jgi:oligopeptidase A
VVQAARNEAQAAGRPGHKLTLHIPSYLPVMQYAENRALRERLYRAYTTRASDLGPAALDNAPLIRELLALRQEEATLIGHPTAADLSLVPKMASSPAQVIEFLEDLARRARAGALRDLAELRDFARTELGLADLQAWDMYFASQKLKESRYAFSEQAVKQYFTEPKVLEGLFHIVETVFEVRIRPDTAPVWHPSVRFFRIERDDPAAIDGKPRLVGQFYLDLFTRPGKRPGAWMDDVRDRWLRPEGRLQTPVAHLVCNFAAPVAADGVTRPALLTHDDVTTLFHEFGHGLQQMLTQIDDIGVSGISGVEWDAVELPSQFMENFCWEWNVVRRLTAHVDTGAPMPRELFDRMLAAKNFHSGLGTLRQVELSLVDMRLHTTIASTRHSASMRSSRACAPRSRCCGRRPSTARSTPSRTSSTAAMRRATTATSGPRCSRPMPGAPSKRRPTCSTSRPAGAIGRRCSKPAGAAARWRASRRFAAASRASTHCCDTRAWPEPPAARQTAPSGTSWPVSP